MADASGPDAHQDEVGFARPVREAALLAELVEQPARLYGLADVPVEIRRIVDRRAERAHGRDVHAVRRQEPPKRRERVRMRDERADAQRREAVRLRERAADDQIAMTIERWRR